MKIGLKELRARLDRLPRTPWRWGDANRRESAMNLYSYKGDSEIGPGFPILWLDKDSWAVTLRDTTEFIRDAPDIVVELLAELKFVNELYEVEHDRADDNADEVTKLEQRLADMTAARDKACEQWESHLDGAVKRALGGEDGGYRRQRQELEACRRVGTPVVLGPECKVCGARPNADGEREHGKGCYHVSENAGGADTVDVEHEP